MWFLILARWHLCIESGHSTAWHMTNSHICCIAVIPLSMHVTRRSLIFAEIGLHCSYPTQHDTWQAIIFAEIGLHCSDPTQHDTWQAIIFAEIGPHCSDPTQHDTWQAIIFAKIGPHCSDPTQHDTWQAITFAEIGLHCSDPTQHDTWQAIIFAEIGPHCSDPTQHDTWQAIIFAEIGPHCSDPTQHDTWQAIIFAEIGVNCSDPISMTHGELSYLSRLPILPWSCLKWVLTTVILTMADLYYYNHGHWFSIKISSYRHRKHHHGDKTVVKSSYLHDGFSYTGKIESLYWISPLHPIRYG